MAVNNQHANSGRYVKEDGNNINIADINDSWEKSNIGMSSRMGNVYRAFYEASDVVEGTYEFVIDIPEGVEFYGLTRLTSVEQGIIESTFLVCDGFTADAFNMRGYNFDETLEDRSQSTFREVTVLTNASARTPDIRIISPTTGLSRIASIQTESGFQPKFDSNHLPAFRYTVDTGGADYLYIQLTWQEI